MTVSELRTLVENLDEYIHTPGGIDRLKKMVLHLAASGQLVPQDASEGTGEELYEQIQAEKVELVKQGKIKKQKTSPVITRDEIPFEIPNSWRWIRVSDTGYALGQKVPDQEFCYIDVASIDNESQRLRRPSVLLAKDAPSRARKIVKEGTVIYSTVRPYLLNTTIIERGFDKELIASTAFAVLHPFNGVSPQWLLRNLTSDYFTNYTNQKSVGMAYPAINYAQFIMAPMPLPPPAEQERIVAKVDTIFALIDQLAQSHKSEQDERSKLVASSLAQLAKTGNRAKDSLALVHLSEIIRTKVDAKVLRKAILHLAVSGQLVPQDASEGTGEELYEQIQAEKLGDAKHGKIKKHAKLSEIRDDEAPYAIPNSWKWVRIGDISRIDNGNAFKSEEYTQSGLRIIRISNVQDGYIEDKDPKYVDENRLDEFRKYELFDGDVLMSLTGYVGRTAVLTSEYLPALLNQRVARIVWNKMLDVEFVGHYLSGTVFMDAALASARGAAQPNMSTEWLKSYCIPLPPLAEQNRIIAKTTRLLDFVTELESHIKA